MNATVEYQSFASALVKNTSTPSNTCVTEDEMHITYGEKTLSVAKWRCGLQKLLDEVTADLDALCLNNTFGLDLSAEVYDDWSNDHRGYSWTKNGKFLADKRSLLAAMLKEPGSKLAVLTEAGELEFNHVEVWDFLHKCDIINEKLALLTFFTVGQTSHVTEFVEHKYANST